MQIAMRDLDIRGAGDLLGAEQSGFINDLGFDMYQRILAEAVKELKEEQFKDLMEAEQAASGQYVEETVLETDLSLLIPDHYISDIPERISLYRELDSLNNANDMKGFRDRLEDRFGPLPVETEELLGTIRLRWVAQLLGMEKLVLKSGKLIAAFVADKESAYFQSATFSRVLEYLKRHAKDASMYQRNGGLRLKLERVETVLQALAIFEDIAGMPAEDAAELTNATSAPIPRAAPSAEN
jgi:transcription-repair coupling factor (superfamily II helicase)